MSDLLPQVLEFTNKDFNLEIPESEVSTRDEFLELLTKVVQHLLDTDFERLLNGLYRIDVNENKVKQAMASSGNIAREIALLIIERELQKVETRKKYRN